MAPESLTRLRVLVVDDEKRLTELLRLELDVEGYDVDVEQDGAGGLIRSRTDPTPDLVILDWNLPDFSGIDICQRMRAGGLTIPILMLTGHDEITDRVKALDAGEDLDAKLANQKRFAESSGDAEQAWKAEVWEKMLLRIRKMESMLNPPGEP